LPTWMVAVGLRSCSVLVARSRIISRQSSVVQLNCRVSQKVDDKQLFFDPPPKSPTFDLLRKRSSNLVDWS
jgi:hypothetical protein